MSFNFDEGQTGSQGPFVTWKGKGTNDGAVPPRSFAIRDDGGTKPFPAFSHAVILDVENMKTGWNFSSGKAGEAPQWKWNPTIARMEPRPDPIQIYEQNQPKMQNWKKGLSIPLAYKTPGGQVLRALWEDSAAGAWIGFTDTILPELKKAAAELSSMKLPAVALVDVEARKFPAGTAIIPKFAVKGWVDRPDCLKDEQPQSGFDFDADEGATVEASAAPAAAVGGTTLANAHADLDDEIPF